MLKTLYNRLISYYYLLRCALVLTWRSAIIISLSWRNQFFFRDFVNRYAQAGAKKILSIVKANYAIEYIKASAIKENVAYIFMSNHQSLIDLPLIYATCPGTIRMVTKAELFRMPIFGGALRASECVPIERKNKAQHAEFIANVKKKLKSGVSIWFFPEGTRSRCGSLLPFKTGGFRVASETHTHIVPVGIVNTRAILPPKTFTLSLNQHVKIRIGEPISVGPLSTPEALNDIIVKVRHAIERLTKMP